MRFEDEILHEPLKTLAEIDCPTSGCAANATATGRLVFRSTPLSCWLMEMQCPDCGDTFTRGSARVQQLAAALREPQSEARDARIASLIEAMRASRKGC